MPHKQMRFRWISRLARVWLMAALVFSLMCMMLVAAWGFAVVDRGAWRSESVLVLTAGVLVLIALIGAAIVAGLVDVFISSEQNTREIIDRLNRLESLQEAVHATGRRLVDLAQMSDTAKSLLYRQREQEAASEVFHDYLMRQEYEQAESFINDIEQGLGHAVQVQALRQELAAARRTTLDQKVDAALERINRLVEATDWAAALRLAERLSAALPGAPKVAALPAMIDDARNKFKRELLTKYGEAVKVGDIDRSIQLLQELDKFLTPQEAAALEESARGVFKAKLHNLNVQFSIRATDKQWAEAVAIGEQIMREYPNTRMAQEVRQKMDALRALAAGQRNG